MQGKTWLGGRIVFLSEEDSEDESEEGSLELSESGEESCSDHSGEKAIQLRRRKHLTLP